MKTIRLYACLALIAGFTMTASAGEEWIPLFDGKTLDGWILKVTGYPLGENPGNLFRVEDGTIRVCYEAFPVFEGQFGHLFYKSPYSRYKLRLEYRFFGEQTKGGPGWAYKNSGLMVHGQTAESMGLDQKFPDSIEVQFLGSDSTHQRPTGNICTPGTVLSIKGTPLDQHCVQSSSPPMPGDEWVELEVQVNGSEEIIVLVDGMEVFRGESMRSDAGSPLASGTLSLQAESHDCAFRNVRILPLDAPAKTE
ncbi:MAG TPA: DUF1080 domain-containing protein [Oceanipulchritudo sp.]|nr:DUF1080 domain-containing protein [Oceanipulchritudo sp.]